MAERYTGVLLLEGLSKDLINTIHKQKKIPIEWLDQRHSYYPHQFLVLKNGTSRSALARVTFDCKTAILLDNEIEAYGIRPKNKEQTMAMSALMDEEIPLTVLTGRAGTGKTLLSMAVALHKMDLKRYDRLIITRPMSQVGRRDLGALPGDVKDKFGPYLINYMSNLEQLVKVPTMHTLQQYRVEFLPLQLIRGASFFNCIILADETQVLDRHEMLTLGSRVGEGCKIIIMGDLRQRDENIAREKTGIYKLMNDKRIKESPLVSAIELKKVERSPLAQLFAEVFDET